MSDPYAVLGLKRGATDEECKAAYRKLAMENHPDRNPGDKTKEERFKEVSAAYDAITKPQPEPQRHPGFGGHGGFHPFNLDEILHAFNAQQRQRNQDLHTSIQISLEEAFNGREVTMSLNMNGDIKEISVKIPPGVDNGSRIRVPQVGDHTFPSLPAGDLYVAVHVHAHPTLGRAGKDLVTQIEVDVLDVLLGTTVGVMGIDGKRLEAKIPQSFDPAKQLRLSGQGMPIIQRQTRGDLLVQVIVKYPTLTAEQVELLKTIRNMDNSTPDANNSVD